jgi:hypothetical protein
MTPISLKARDLKLADTIDLGFSPWGTAIVKKITTRAVELFRPYGTTADFSCTGGVICYTGIEDINVSLESVREFCVIERKELK